MTSSSGHAHSVWQSSFRETFNNAIDTFSKDVDDCVIDLTGASDAKGTNKQSTVVRASRVSGHQPLGAEILVDLLDDKLRRRRPLLARLSPLPRGSGPVAGRRRSSGETPRCPLGSPLSLVGGGAPAVRASPRLPLLLPTISATDDVEMSSS